MALRYHLATYDAVTYLVGDEIVSGTPTFTHTDTIYAKCSDGYYHLFSADKRVVKNGRYVDEDNVYADNGSGVLLDPMPYVVYQDAAENSALESNDQTQVSTWETIEARPTVAKDQVGLTSAANTGCLITASDAAFWEGLLQQVTVTVSQTHTAVAYVKQEAVTDEIPAFDLELGASRCQVQWNKSTGATALTNSSGTYDYKIVDDGNWWKVFVEITGDATDTVLDVIYWTCTGDTLGILDKTVAGSTVVGNVEVYKNSTIEDVENLGPIFTTTAAVPIGAITNTYPAVNWSNSEGPIYIEFYYTGEDQVIILNDDVPILYVTSDVLYLDDGTNQISIACSTIGLRKAGFALDASGGNMSLNLDATWHDE